MSSSSFQQSQKRPIAASTKERPITASTKADISPNSEFCNDLPDSTVALLWQSYQINPNPSKYEIIKISQSLAEPIPEYLVSQWFDIQNTHQQNISNEDSAQSSVDISSSVSASANLTESVEISLKALLAHNSLEDPAQVPKFIRIMNKASENDRDISMALNVLLKTKKQVCLYTFITGKGMIILDNWAKTFGLKNDSCSILVLKSLNVLPFVVDVFKGFGFGKFVKKMSKSGNNECKQTALRLMEKWTKLTEEQTLNPIQLPKYQAIIEPNTGAKRSSSSSSDLPSTKKPKAISLATGKSAVESKKLAAKNVSAVGSFDIFSKLAAGPIKSTATSTLTPLPKKDKSASSPIEKDSVAAIAARKAALLDEGTNFLKNAAKKLNSGSSLSAVNDLDLDKPLAYSYKKSDLPARNGKRKSVKFKPDSNLMDVRYFGIDDTPQSISERLSLAQEEETDNSIVDLLQPQIPWRRLQEILVPSFTRYKVKSSQIKIQERRETSVVSCVFVDESDIPFSPAEPEPEEYTESLIQSIPWPLNTVIQGAPLTLNLGLLSSLLPVSGNSSASSYPTLAGINPSSVLGNFSVPNHNPGPNFSRNPQMFSLSNQANTSLNNTSFFPTRQNK